MDPITVREGGNDREEGNRVTTPGQCRTVQYGSGVSDTDWSEVTG